MAEHERFNPEMLQLAREFRDLTQSELAERAKLTQGYVSQLEHGDRDPLPEKVAQLAAVLGVPPEFFYQAARHSGVGLSLMYYRKKSSAQLHHIRRLQAEASVRRIEVTRLLRDLNVRTAYTFTKMDIDEHDGDAERIAQFLRVNWSLPVGPVRHLVHAIESGGGLVFKFPFGTPDIDAMSQWPDDCPPLFFINADAPADRIRFSLAHELGHVVMHSAASETMETEADRFAAEFLMPARDVTPELTGMTIQKAAALKPSWRVSMAALIRRARDTGRLAPSTYTQIVRRMSMLGYRKREPGPISHEEPAFVPAILSTYRERIGCDNAQLAKVCHWYTHDFEARYALRQPGMRIAQ